MTLAALILAALPGPADLPPTDRLFTNLDSVAMHVGLRPLRHTLVAPENLELRVWTGGYWGGASDFLLSRRKGIWRAEQVFDLPSTARYRPHYGRAPIPAPPGGWGRVWRELDALGIRTIPDQGSTPDDDARVYDVAGYLFEIASGGRYRVYYYYAPEYRPNKAFAPRVAQIVRIIWRTMPHLGS